MSEIFDLFPTDADNVGRWPEGMQGGGINNAGRADEGILGRWYQDTNASRMSSNVGNAFSITSVRTIPALFDNLIMVFTANITSNGPVTLNLNGLGAKPIKRFNLTELAVGDIISNTPIAVLYKLAHDTWFMTNAPAALVTNMFGDFSENAAPGNPAVNVGRLYAKDVSGVTFLAYRDSAGLERVLSHAGELIAIIEDRQAQNTDGGALPINSTTVRTLNTLAFNRNSLVSLASNQFTLPAGTWEIEWWAPIGGAGNADFGHQSLLRNQTDATEVARGGSATYDRNADTGGAFVTSAGRAVTTIAAPKAFEIQHSVGAATGSINQGGAANRGPEVYTRVTVRRA